MVHGITTSGSPEYYRKAERLNRALLNMSRCTLMNMVTEKKHVFWAEYTDAPNYLRNRLFNRSRESMVTPVRGYSQPKAEYLIHRSVRL